MAYNHSFRPLPAVVLFIFGLCFSCNSRQGNSAVVVEESFDSFNRRFHEDSLFQIARIQFPLGGKHVDAWEAFSWNRQNWQMMKVPVREWADTTSYQHKVSQRGSKVVEIFWVDESGFRVERHFEQKAGKWYLTYFNDVNL